jgi:DNA-binding response OmpR family regulator
MLSHQAHRGLAQVLASLRPRRVILVDEDPHSRRPLASVLEEEGYQVTEVARAQDLYDYLGRPLGTCQPFALPDLVIADMDTLGGPSGLDVLAGLRYRDRQTPVILLAENADWEDERHAMEMGASYVFPKSSTTEDLRYAALSLIQPW